jgi:phage-related tail fiber protein
VVSTSSAGFSSAADKTKLDGISAGADVTIVALAAASAPIAVNSQRITNLGAPIAATDAARVQDLLDAAVVAGAGLVRAGTTLNVVADADASIVVAADSLKVGTLATDAQHGTRGGGTQHAVVSTSSAGFSSAADKTKLDGISAGADVTIVALAAASAPIAVNGQRITNLGTPTATTDAATKAYVDAAPPILHSSTHADGGADELSVAGLSGLLADPQTAGGLKTATTTVAIAAAAAPAIDAALMANSSTAAAWRIPPNATTSLPGYMSAADKLKLDGVATSAAAVGSAAASQVTVTTAGPGSSATAARADHIHSVATAAPSALTVGGAQAPGTSSSLARADHGHAMPGLATGAADGFQAAADFTKLAGIEAGAQVTSFARVQTALGVASSAVSFNAQRLSSVLDPSAAQDAATKAYVDAIAQGLDIKASVRLVATSNVAALTGNVSIDGSTTAPGQRVLLVGQTTASANGIYLTAAGAWARTTDADTSAKVTSGMYVFATEGTANSDSGWALITPDPIVLGTTALTFSQVTGAGQITAGAGLVKSGNTLDVVAHADGSIIVAADSVQLGVIATDAQHGVRAGGTTHAAVIAGGASGFMTGADKTKIDGIEAGAQVTSFARVQTALAAASSAVAFNAQRLTGVADPTAAQDVATKAYVDASPLSDFKESVRVATTTNPGTVTSAAPNIVDGVTLVAGNRVLNKSAGAGTLGGIWVVQTVGTGANGVWARAADADVSAEVTAGMVVFVTEGAVNADTGWILTPNDPLVVGSNALDFQRFTITPAEIARIDSGALPYSASVAVNTWTIANSAGTRTLPSPANAGDTVAILVTQTGCNIAAGSGNQIVDASGSGYTTLTSVPMPALYTFRCAVAGFWFFGDNVASSTLPGLMTAGDKTILDGLVGRRFKDVCDIFTDLPITLSGTASYAAGLRALVMGQADATTNGIYVTAAGAWPRATDADSSADFGRGIVVPVLWFTEGTSGLLLWATNTELPLVLGTTPIVFREEKGAQWLLDTLDDLGTAVAWGFQRLTSVGDPINDWDAATQGYVKTAVAAVAAPAAYKAPAKLVATTNITQQAAGGTVAIDSVSTANGDRVLLTGQTDPKLNGLYIVGATAWARATDANTGALLVAGSIVPVNEGTINANTAWMLATDGTITLGTTSLSFVQVVGQRGTAAPTSVAAGVASAQGTSSTWASIDHVHGIVALDHGLNNFRISNNATSMPTTATASTVTLAPHDGNRVALYDGTNWQNVTLASGATVSVTGQTTGRPCDVFLAYNSLTTATLVLTPWTSANARATAIVQQNGVWVKSGTLTQRYLGTILPDSSTTFTHRQDTSGTTFPICGLWNQDNRISGGFFWLPTSSSWGAGSAWSQLLGTSTSKLQFVQGQSIESVDATLLFLCESMNTGSLSAVAFGFDTASTPSGMRGMTSGAAGFAALTATYNRVSATPGVHNLNAIAQSSDATALFYGTTGTGQSGITATLWF